MAKGLLTAVGTFVVGLIGPTGFDAFVLLWGGTELGIAVSCALGVAGAGFALAGRRYVAAYLMLVGAVGVCASTEVYVLLQPAATGPAFEPYLSPGLVPDSAWHAVQLFPVPLLLVGAALASLARER
jgi:hypothetical protein